MNGRCAWAEPTEPMRRYHDEEWGRPSHDDRYLFEMLVLEGAQAGLSWSTILNKRENYRRAFADFDPEAIASFSEDRLAEILQDRGIVRNRLKVHGCVKNARAYLSLIETSGSFADHLWAYVDGQPVVNERHRGDALPASTALSDRVSKDLKKRGFTFVGTTIVYSFLQATGLVNDHVTDCPARFG